MEMVLAEAAVSFAVEKLGEALINKVAFLGGVEEQVNLLKDELEMMYGFLQDATQKQATNKRIGVWISQIRRVAHDVEDVIETFSLKINTPRRSRGKLMRCACFPSDLKHLNKLGKEIESILARLENIDKRRAWFGIVDQAEGSEPRRPLNIALQRRQLVPQQKDKDVVGLENSVNELLRESILNDNSGLSIACITGIGGLGKSTLAREVYNHADVVARFDFRAWVVVSQEFDPKEIIKKLLLELLGSEEEMKKLCVDMLSLEELKAKLCGRLWGRQYLIVLDDVWRQQHWELLKDAFPEEQEKTSRLLVTSRNRNVPNTAQFATELQPLDPKTSWQLFLKKSFIHDRNGKCPQNLEKIGRQIVRKCGGLPLAITVVSGLLLNERPSRGGWAKILNGFDSYLSRSENRVSIVVELSYHNLPPRLKSCFLCLGFFREDDTIPAEKLVQVWIAEGLIPQDGRDETMEEIASGYLDELINQNLVQVEEMTKDGDRVKTCQIHDLVRDLSINKAKEEIGFEILKEGIHSQSSDKFRHHAIYCSPEKLTSLVRPNNKHIRSLFFHSVADIDRVPSFNWKNFILLRILDFEDFGLRNLPDTIGTLIGLRYLGLRYNYLAELPISVGCLVNLQVLDILWNDGIKVSDILWKLKSLRHLYMDDLILEAPLRLNTLKNLQTLVCDESERRWMWPKHIMEMTNLRKLDVWISEQELHEFISSLAKLKNLVCLKVKWHEFNIPMSDLNVLSTLHNLIELKLCGKLVLPFCDFFPPSLSQLTLDGTGINQDTMQVLENLPNLMYLYLRFNAYVGREMVISDDGFPNLRFLRVTRLEELRKIEFVGEGHGMLELKRFEIEDCQEVESLPKSMNTSVQVEIYKCPKLESLSKNQKSALTSAQAECSQHDLE